MEKIEHTTVPTNGISMHVASIGTGPAILFLHGFPELWYTWRHQMMSLSSLGYRCIAPDLRGYGDTDAPPSPESYTALHIAGDLVGLLDHLGIEQAFVVGHDWGAVMAWYFCLFRPDRVKALVNMSIAFPRRNPDRKPIESFRALLGDDYYICRFQLEFVPVFDDLIESLTSWEKGLFNTSLNDVVGQPVLNKRTREAEKDFARDDTANLLKKFYLGRNPRPPCIPKDIGLSGLKAPRTMPSWLSEEDVKFFARKFDEKGFTGGLNYYRALNLTWELTAAWTGVQVKVPVKFIIGDLDATYHIPGAKEYIHNGGFKRDVPYLQEVVVMEGVAHFINQEKAEETTAHIYDFIKKF